MIYKHTLPNGLQIIAEERKAIPMVTVWSWYRVGSGCEVPGITGITHLCEHMNFKTSKSYPREGELDAAIAAWGGSINGYTWIDTTTHYNVVLKDGLDEALKVEAERMHAMNYNSRSIETERGVVISEYNGGENDPEELLDKAIQLTSFTAHGYRWPTIGMISDLRTFTPDQVRDHYNKNFVPDNATLVVVGNFSWPDLKKKIQFHFGHIPASGFQRKQRTAEPTQEGVKRVEVKGVGEVPYLSISFHTPAGDARDAASVLMLRGILSGGGPLGIGHGSYGSTRRSSRLYKALVETETASRVKAFFTLTRDPFVLGITAALHSEKDFDAAEKAVFKVMNNLAQKGPGKKEIERAISQFSLAFRLEEEKIGSRAENFGYFSSILDSNAWNRLKKAVLKQKVGDVMKAASSYGSIDNATIGRFLPRKKPVARSKWERLPKAPVPPKAEKFTPRLPSVKKECLPDFHLKVNKFTLSNSLKVLSCTSRTQRTVTVRLLLPAGSSQQKKPGGIAELAARSCELGTASFSKNRILNTIDSMGTNIGSYAGRESAAVELTVVPPDLQKALRLVFSIASEPLFEAGELKSEYKKLDNERRSMLEDPYSVSHRHLIELLYKGNSFRFHPTGPENGFPLRRKEVIDFHRKTWLPEGSTLVVTGNFKQGDLERFAEKACSSWNGKVHTVSAHPSRHRKGSREHAEMPGKAQADIAIGRLLPVRLDPAYPALRLLDRVLGQIILMGRLGARLRTEKGLAYYSFSNIHATKHSSYWSIHAGVAPQNINEAVRETQNVLSELGKEGASEKECDLAKAGIVSGIIFALQTSGGTSGLLSLLALSDLPLDYLTNYVSQIKTLKRKKINNTAEQYLTLDDFSIVTAGPVPGNKK